MKKTFPLLTLVFSAAACLAGVDSSITATMDRLEESFSLDRVAREHREVCLDDLTALPGPNSQHVPVQACGHPDVLFVLPDMVLAAGRDPAPSVTPPALALGFALGEPPVFPDFRQVTRRLHEGYLPIVISTWQHGNLLLEQTAFGFLPQNREVRTGKESQHLVVRLKLRNTGNVRQATSLTVAAGLALGTQGANYAPYEPKLERWSAGDWKSTFAGNTWKLNDKVLLLCKAEAARATEFNQKSGIIHRALKFPCDLKPGESRTIDLIVSGSPRLSDVAELPVMRRIRFDKALASATAHWNRQLAPGMRLTTPEDRLNNTYKHLILSSLGNMSVMPDKPWTEPYQSPFFAGVWPWEFAHMAVPLCGLGYTKPLVPAFRFFTERQNDVGKFSANAKIPGATISARGAFSGSALAWMADTGSALWAMGAYYRCTHDNAWLTANRTNLLEAWNWIQRERAATRVLDPDGKPALGYGLLPMGRADDSEGSFHQFTMTDNYTWKGMNEVAAAFREAGLPEAERLRADADDYRNSILNAMHREEFTDPKSGLVFTPHTTGWQKGPRGNYWHAAGPVQFFATGFLKPNDPRFAATLAHVKRDNGLFLGLAESLSEGSKHPIWYIGQVEPAYYAGYLARGEVEKSILTLYSVLAYGISRDCLQTCERTDFVEGNWAPFQPNASANGRILGMMKRMVIDEQEADKGRLWFLRGCPRRWFAPGKEISVDRAPTQFGMTAMRTKARRDRITLDLDLPKSDSLREVCIALRTPENTKISGVTIGGKQALAEGNLLHIPSPPRHLTVLIQLHSTPE